MISRHSAILASLVLVVLIAIYHFNSGMLVETASTASSLIPLGKGKKGGDSTLNPEVLNYFEQVFSVAEPAQYDYPGLREQCQRAPQPAEEIYIKCVGMVAGLTSIMSELKVCLKMATDVGANLILPSMPLRDSKNLAEFNFLNGDAYLDYDQWFDVEHLINQARKACPHMKIIHPRQLDANTSDAVAVKYQWEIKISDSKGYPGMANPWFWPGMPFKTFFDDQYKKLREIAKLDAEKDSKPGATVITMTAPFLLYRIIEDPTGHDLRLWNDLGMLIRFRQDQREITHELLAKMNRPWFGVHFRAENDTIWSSADAQLAVDLDALDKAWSMYGKEGTQKPLVYLACGDEGQIEKFVQQGADRGWEVTHKWALAQGNKKVFKMINDLAFDFQGAVDMGVMVRSDFFLGITGSAFSNTVAHARDKTGRYRGSSFTVYDDGNARTHLFNDGLASGYPCCL